MINSYNANVNEWKFLFNCLTLFVRQNQKGDSGNPKSDESLDWQFICETAQAHRVLPFLMVVLEEGGSLDVVPENIRSQMVTSSREAQWQNSVKMLEFNRIQRIFESQRVPIIPLKGVALTNLVYEQYPFRRMGDIDVLVNRDDLKKVERLMKEHGFQWQETVNHWHAAMFRELFGRGDLLNGELALDLQWDSQFIIGGQFCSLDWSRVWDRHMPFGKLGHNVFLLDSDDQITYLSLQILNDIEVNAPYLIQLLDLALVLKKYGMNCREASETVISRVNFSSEEKLHGLFSLLDECFFGHGSLEMLSKGSINFLEQFLTASQKNQRSFRMPINNVIASPWRRLMFAASYFFPSRKCLKIEASTSIGHGIMAYFNYWRSLISRIGVTINS